VLVEPVYPNGQPMEACPRYVARQQLQRLQAHGLRLKSGSEMEFMLLDGATKSTPISAMGYATCTGHAAIEEFMYDVDKLMLEAGISLENIHEEFLPGQFEFILAPALGIDGADQVFKFKHSLREIATAKGMAATFISVLEANGAGNGMHYNHSLLDANDANAFYDASKPDNLSDIARWWIGGLMKHAKALCALCFTTVNCARRIGAPWSPSKRNWGLDDREAFLRVKSQRPEFTYMENRLPGGAANPYLVMAATVAAGLDGIENQIPCPPAVPAAQEMDMLPRSLAEAIDNLKVKAFFYLIIISFSIRCSQCCYKGINNLKVRGSFLLFL
jgi:glutamine synthetase